MLRFGNHDSPVLLEVLSDLLLADWNSDAKLLATRALLRAAESVDDPQLRAAYRSKATDALSMQTPRPNTSRSMSLEELEARLAPELEEARAFAAEVRADELEWIEEGGDVDALFAEKYYREPTVGQGLGAPGGSSRWPLIAAFAALGLMGAGLLARRRAAA